MSVAYWKVNGWILKPSQGVIQVLDPDWRVREVFNSAVAAENFARGNNEHARLGGHHRGYAESHKKTGPRVNGNEIDLS